MYIQVAASHMIVLTSVPLMYYIVYSIIASSTMACSYHRDIILLFMCGHSLGTPPISHMPYTACHTWNSHTKHATLLSAYSKHNTADKVVAPQLYQELQQVIINNSQLLQYRREG